MFVSRRRRFGAFLALMLLTSGCGSYQGVGGGAPSASNRVAAKALVDPAGSFDGLRPMGNGRGSLTFGAPLPARVDLRAGCSPVRDQGATFACVAYATAGLGEFLAIQQHRPVTVSPRFIWNLARQQEGRLNENVTIWPHTALQVADEVGFVPESSFPLKEAPTGHEPSFGAWCREVPGPGLIAQAANLHLMKGRTAVTTVQDMKASLAEGLPVVIAMGIFPSFHQTGPSGVFPMPGPNEQRSGGHSMLVVGYDDARQLFIVRNSWGVEWGDRGYGYLPYGYVTAGPVFEGFTAKL